jgi:hypothetical protein
MFFLSYPSWFDNVNPACLGKEIATLLRGKYIIEDKTLNGLHKNKLILTESKKKSSVLKSIACTHNGVWVKLNKFT